MSILSQTRKIERLQNVSFVCFSRKSLQVSKRLKDKEYYYSVSESLCWIKYVTSIFAPSLIKPFRFLDLILWKTRDTFRTAFFVLLVITWNSCYETFLVILFLIKLEFCLITKIKWLSRAKY